MGFSKGIWKLWAPIFSTTENRKQRLLRATDLQWGSWKAASYVPCSHCLFSGLLQFSGGRHIPEKSSSMGWEEPRPGPAWETLNHLSQTEERKKYRNVDIKIFIPLWKLERHASFLSILSGMLPAPKTTTTTKDLLGIRSLWAFACSTCLLGSSRYHKCRQEPQSLVVAVVAGESECLHKHLFPQRHLVHTQWPVRGEAWARWGTLTSYGHQTACWALQEILPLSYSSEDMPVLVPRGIHLLLPKWRQTCSYAWTLKFRGITLYLPRLSTVQVSVWKRQFRIQGSWPQKGELSPQRFPLPSHQGLSVRTSQFLFWWLLYKCTVFKDSCTQGQNLTGPLLQSVVQPGSLHKHILERPRASCLLGYILCTLVGLLDRHTLESPEKGTLTDGQISGTFS